MNKLPAFPIKPWRRCFPSCCLAFFLFPIVGGLRAGVEKVEILKRVDVADTNYEEIGGRLHFSIDPNHPRNREIADVALAPTDERGRVVFFSDFILTRPRSEGGIDAAWLEVPNRGGRSSERKFLMDRGFTILEVGWEFDVPEGENRLNIEVPVAKDGDGGAIRGVVESIFVVNETTEKFTVTDLAMYPPVESEGEDSRLVVREKGDTPGGAEVPREKWSLEGNVIGLEGGFRPGLTYAISWLAEGPPVAGLGYAALRDAAVWLKDEAASLAPVRRVYGFGSSQCGRLLRDFVYQGFNTDEQERIAFDGMLPLIAGAGRVDLNRRWSTPRELALFRTASYPFADVALPDPVSGLEEGILENPRVTHRPRIFYVNTAAEYWGAGRVAALVHADSRGDRDLVLPDEVRVYAFAGTQHGPAKFPPDAPVEGAPLANPVNFKPSIQALRLALHRWVSEAEEPPPSCYPRFDDATLVRASEVKFPDLPGVPSPKGLTAGLRMHNPRYLNGAGAGEPLPLIVFQVDRDGNDLGGIRLPEVAVPLATATGWMFRPPAMGAPDELLPVLRGSWIPFALTREEREKSGDPRLSIAERYGSRADYLAASREVAESLVARGYLLPEDLEEVMESAAERWDWRQTR